MFDAFGEEDLLDEIRFRRPRIYKCNEEILCQRPRVMYAKNCIYMHWAMYYLDSLLSCESERILALILVYARPIHVVRVSTPFQDKTIILRSDDNYVFRNLKEATAENDCERQHLREELRYHLFVEAWLNMRRRSLHKMEVVNLSKLRNCRARMPLPRIHLVF